MLIDDFKIQYTTIPFATSFREYKKGGMKSDLSTLSHLHREMEILSVLGGRAKFILEGKTYDIEKGDIVIIPPFNVHNFIILAEYDFNHICLCFDLDLLYDKDLKSKMEKNKITTCNIIRDEVCSRYLEESFMKNKDKNAGWEFKVIGNISLFFGRLKEKNWIFESNFSEKNNMVRQIMEYIFKNYDLDISSSKLAAELHINNSYFCRYFKKTFGCTFQNYLSNYRVEKAKILLRNTDFTISEISQKVGFESFAYFSKIFKSITGITPKQYRRENT